MRIQGVSERIAGSLGLFPALLQLKESKPGAASPAADSAVGAIGKGIDSILSEPSRLNYFFLHGGLFLFLTLLLVLVIKFINRVAVRMYGVVRRNRGVLIRPIKIRNLDLITLDQLTTAAFKSVKVVRWVLIIFSFYLYLTLAFSLFVWTQIVAQKLLGYFVTPLVGIGSGILSYLPNLFYIIVVAVVARYFLKLMKLIFSKVEDGTIDIPLIAPELARPTYQIAAFLLVVFVAVMIFPYLPGSQSAAARGISIFLALLLSLGSSSAVSNIIAGVVITYMRSFRMGDRVKINETLGDIVEHNFLVTRVRTTKNEEITIPNSVVLSGHITNYSAIIRGGSSLVLYTSVTIGYDAPWRQVHELLINAALATGKILSDPRPFVLQTALNDFYVSYQINAYKESPGEMQNIYSELHQNIQNKFFEAGVEIASPHYYSLRDGNRRAIPDQFVEDGYKSPPFKVSLDKGDLKG